MRMSGKQSNIKAGFLFLIILSLLFFSCVGARGEPEQGAISTQEIVEANLQKTQNDTQEAAQQIELKKIVLVPDLPVNMMDGSRIALIIGNSAYSHMNTLPNPKNDAEDICQLLTQVGFDTELLLDGSLSEIDVAARSFLDKSRIEDVTTSLFFYAGHAVQYEGSNYLIPVDADIKRDNELLGKAFNMDVLLKGLERSSADLNLIILDACRDNPFSTTRGGARGLSAMGFGTAESMVIFATAPGTVAEDGSGRNSPFTSAMKEYLPTPDLEVRQLIAQVSKSVQEQTKGRQIPWVNTSFTGQFFFLTGEQELQLRKSQLSSLSSELAHIEAEIAARQQVIGSTQDIEERGRLQLEQQRSQALAVSKRMEEDRIKVLQRDAEERMKIQQKEQAERLQLQSQLSEEGRALEELAQQRRAELEHLSLQQSSSQGAMARLRTIAQYEKTIVDVRESYDATIKLSNSEFEKLKKAQVESFKRADPQDPWETNEEFARRVKVFEMPLESENRTQIALIEAQRDRELSQLNRQLSSYKAESERETFKTDFVMTEVKVQSFDAQGKFFPIEVFSKDSLLPFSTTVYFHIRETERTAIGREYARIDDAVKANALVASIEYSIREDSPQKWAISAKRVNVYTLLEGEESNPICLVSEEVDRSVEVSMQMIMRDGVVHEDSGVPIVGERGPGGGIVFFDKGSYSDGWRYLEAAPAGWSGSIEDPNYIFGYYRQSSYGGNREVGTSTVLGSGRANTVALVSSMGNLAYSVLNGSNRITYAAKVASDYSVKIGDVTYNDWFLPSKEELNEIYKALKQKNLGNFSDVVYWSSSETSGSVVWGQFFDYGGQGAYYRYSEFKVRPIRAF